MTIYGVMQGESRNGTTFIFENGFSLPDGIGWNPMNGKSKGIAGVFGVIIQIGKNSSGCHQGERFFKIQKIQGGKQSGQPKEMVGMHM